MNIMCSYTHVYVIFCIGTYSGEKVDGKQEMSFFIDTVYRVINPL